MNSELDSPDCTDSCADGGELKAVDAQHRAAVDELYRQHHHPLVILMSSKMRSKQAGEEIAAQAFAAVFTFLRANPGGKVHSLEGYLYRTARNLAFKEYGRRKREVLVDDAADGESSGEPGDELDGAQTPEALVTWSQEVQEVRRKLSELPFRRQLIMRLKFWVTDSPREIIARCRELGVEVNNERMVQRDIEDGLDDLRGGVAAGSIEEGRK